MKRRVSYSRITGTAFLIIVMIFGIDFLRRSSSDKKTDEQLQNSIKVSTETPSESQVTGVEVADSTISGDNEYIIKLGPGSYKYRNIQKTSSDLSIGSLVLVNKDHPFASFSEQRDIIKISDEKKTDSYKLAYLTLTAQKSIISPLNRMLDDFSGNYSHKDVTVSSSFISYDEQNDKYISPSSDLQYLTSDQMLAPGYTEHHTGYAVDFLLVSENMNISAFDGSGDYSWITNNCYKYGFVQRYPSSKESATGMANISGHFRYVGIPHSYIMHEKNYTLEEYLLSLKDYSYSGKHLEYELSGNKYEIYYVPSQGETTEVAVPYEFQYTISGNNYDGFIVTVSMASSQTSEDSQNKPTVTTTTSAVTQ